MAKTLELANVEFGFVVSDIMGVTGRAILTAMIEGEEDPKILAGLPRGSLCRKRKELAEVVPGLMRDHHRFLLREQLETIDRLSERIRRLDARIEAVTRPFSPAIELLESMPVGFPSRRPGLTIHVAKLPEGSQTQSESTLTLPSDCPTK